MCCINVTLSLQVVVRTQPVSDPYQQGRVLGSGEVGLVQFTAVAAAIVRGGILRRDYCVRPPCMRRCQAPGGRCSRSESPDKLSVKLCQIGGLSMCLRVSYIRAAGSQ